MEVDRKIYDRVILVLKIALVPFAGVCWWVGDERGLLIGFYIILVGSMAIKEFKGSLDFTVGGIGKMKIMRLGEKMVRFVQQEPSNMTKGQAFLFWTMAILMLYPAELRAHRHYLAY